MNPSNYDGPGIYRHYKGGYYRVLGVAEHEGTGEVVVVYHSYDVERDIDRATIGVDFVCRPLKSAEGVDAWNDFVRDPGPESVGAMVPRFQKVYR